MTRLVLAWHGSADPRSIANTHDVVDHVRRIRPSLDVQAAFLDHATPTLEDALSADRRRAVVVPMLLADAYHARVDIPHRISKSATEKTIQANVLGEDDRLVRVLRQRLAEAGESPHDPGLGVIAVAVGSSHDAANARTATVAHALNVATRWAGASIAFATGPHPSLAETAEFLTERGARRLVIAPWFLAPGRITDRVATEAGVHGIQMALPIGAHPLVAEVILDRYDAACSSPCGASLMEGFSSLGLAVVLPRRVKPLCNGEIQGVAPRGIQNHRDRPAGLPAPPPRQGRRSYDADDRRAREVSSV
jgi:sirohydrochlorin ferrochelatase